MIDATMIIPAQTGARSTSAKSAAAAANGSGGQGPGFAGILANASEDVGAGAEIESGGKLAIAAPEGSGAKKEKSDTTIADATNGGDPAAMIALLVTESRAALAPGAYFPSGDIATAGPGEASMVAAAAIGAAEYPGLVEPPAQAIEPTGGKAALAASSGESFALPRHAVRSAGSADKSDTVATTAAARSPAAKSKVAHVAGAEAAIGRSAAAKTGIANATAANSTIASTAAADAPAGNVKMANAMVADATVASATVANATIANATAANATAANATVANATVANATAANATVANATAANATVANATAANATAANATDANATAANATDANATAANATAANATAANATAANATAANGTVANAIAANATAANAIAANAAAARATAARATAGKATAADATAANATAANAMVANATVALVTRGTFGTAGTDSINDGAHAVSSELPAVDSRPTQPAIARNPASPSKTTNPVGRAPAKVIDTRESEGPRPAGLPARSSLPAGVRAAAPATSRGAVVMPDSGPKYGTKPTLNGAHLASEAEPASSTESTIAQRVPNAMASMASANKPPADTYGATPRPERGTDPSAGVARPIPGARGIAGSPAAVDAADQHAELIPVSVPATAAIPDTANAEARGADRNDFPATTAAAAHGRSSEGAAGREPGSRLTGQVKLADTGEAATAHQGAEPEPASARQAETAPSVSAMSVAAANVADARGTAAAGPAATLLVAAHVQSPAWSKDFGQQVIRLAMDGQPAAEIHLNPADWGPIRVAIDIRGQEAVLQFSAAHGQTREALENALPRLREMFAADNLSLTGANVGAGSFSQQSSNSHGQRFDHPYATPQNERPKVVNAELARPIVRPRPDGSHSRVDLFA